MTRFSQKDFDCIKSEDSFFSNKICSDYEISRTTLKRIRRSKYSLKKYLELLKKESFSKKIKKETDGMTLLFSDGDKKYFYNSDTTLWKYEPTYESIDFGVDDDRTDSCLIPIIITLVIIVVPIITIAFLRR